MAGISATEAQIQYLFHHLFLPPKLPGCDDSVKKTGFLVGFTVQSLQRFAEETCSSDAVAIQTATSMLKNMQEVTDTQGFLGQEGVQAVLKKLSSENPVALFHIAAQNAGLLIRKTDDSFCFETFELSPTNEAVMTTKGRLIREFPATAIQISQTDFQNADFRDALTNTMVKMSHQTASETQQKVMKAQQSHNEERDTTDPRLVAELLTSMLRGVGKSVKVIGISKNTREEISYVSAKLPWRRSPVWILIRVGLQLTMTRLAGGSDDIYKRFMVYLMAQALSSATSTPSPSELLHHMMTKISRRLCKLDSPCDDKWLHTIQRTVTSASQLLSERWANIRKDAEKHLDLQALSTIDMRDNVHFSIPRLDEFVASINQRSNKLGLSSFSPTARVLQFPTDTIPTLNTLVDTEYKMFHLAMIESWVQEHLQLWIKMHVHEDLSCSRLKTLLESYHSVAAIWYSEQPEATSRMLLTIGELWVAADKAAVHAHPMLAEYDAEIPIDIWQALLLQSKADMARLHQLETYLRNRSKAVQANPRPSVFHSYGDRNSFPVRHFEDSPSLKAKKAKIEERAQADKDAKIRELDLCKAEYNDLIQKHDKASCTYVSRTELGLQTSEHDPNCNRCSLKAQANELSIGVYEWPLHCNHLKAKATVFELHVPGPFAAWRDLTFYLVNDVLDYRSDGGSPRSVHPLESYTGLSGWGSFNGSRVQLLSEAKPHIVTHRRQRVIAHTTVSDVCLNNGLSFKYFNRETRSFISGFNSSTTVADTCTFKLPACAQALKPFLVRTWDRPNGETPNQVIASQSSCPDYMSTGEYKALAVLPSGCRLAWLNILRELASPTVDFNKAETTIFLLQMSMQAGPHSELDSDPMRQTHKRLSDPKFDCQMLKYISQCIARVEKNWESHTALCSFTVLATRLLSLADPVLSRRVLDLLNHCRDISYKWLMRLIIKIQDTSDDVQRKEFLETALNIAMICMETFNMDDKFLQKVLADAQQASILVEASLIIHNSSSGNAASQDPLHGIMRERVRQTLHRSRYVMVHEVALKGNNCVDLAIQRNWPDYSRTTAWSLASATCYWLQTKSGQRTVHLSLLTGELLINGSPLARLPRHYELHDDYKRLFGCMILDVMPSDLAGMRFSATKSFQGYSVHFGMQSNDLLVRLVKNGSTMDLVPPRALQGSVPDRFTNDYVHWYDDDTREIEFCKLTGPWATKDPDNWRFGRDDRRWTLGRARTCLVDPGSKLADRIAEILKPLEASLGIHLVYSTNDNGLDIHIPGLQLEFHLRSGESTIKSRQFRNLQIDADQSLGTLVGLDSKLVLRGNRDSSDRMVLIPEGKLEYKTKIITRQERHIAITVTHGTASRVQAYKIDHLLSRLVANTKVESKLFLAYVHALTSFCLPDPFLKRTGTEEAIEILTSASVRAPSAMTETAYERLAWISSLSPSRSFYPKHEKVMQTVNWDADLQFPSQHDRFYTITQEILDRSRKVSFLYPKHKVPEYPQRTCLHLVERAILRASREHVAGFGVEKVTSWYDVKYKARDRGQKSDQAARATDMAVRIFHEHGTALQRVDPNFAVVLYNKIIHSKLVAVRQVPQRSSMHYDSRWLKTPDEVFSSHWYELHYAFQIQQKWLNKFEQMVWLATLSYSDHNDPQITQAFLMLAQSSVVSAAPLAPPGTYDLSKGYKAIADEITQLANQAAKPINACPEASLPACQNETGKETLERRHRQHTKNKTKAVQAFRYAVSRQWPSKTPEKPTDTAITTYLYTEKARGLLGCKWRVWHENLMFMKYLENLAALLSGVPVQILALDPLPGKVMAPPKARWQGFLSIQDLFLSAPPTSGLGQVARLDGLVHVTKRDSEASCKLTGIIDNLDSRARLQYEHRYFHELRQSLSRLQEYDEHDLDGKKLAQHASVFQKHLQDCTSHAEGIYRTLSDGIMNSKTRRSGTKLSDRSTHPPDSWKMAIVEYGVAITAVRKAKRLLKFQSNHADLLRELENTGHTTWNPRDHPEWLLLECESEIMIRDVQQQIAQQMITPPDNKSAVMQLNMGEGKSTVIVPIVATALGDGSKLVRVIVAKPQAKQMHQMLVSKLSGLLDRPVYLLPFSPDIRMNTIRADTIHWLMKRCMKEGGVLMVQPEHLLSFQLMELECKLGNKDEASGQMMNTRNFFDQSSRDIVDESDENFSVKFELIYTLGNQRSIENSPGRWVIIQQVLALVAKMAREAKARSEFSDSLEFYDCHGERHPKIRFLQVETGEAILGRVANSICSTGMSGLPIARQGRSTRDAIHNYMTRWNLTTAEISRVEDSLFWDDTTKGPILLLRGLFAGGILTFTLGQKRWRVNYGVDPNREKGTKLAVPFRAKDNPTPRSEFSHPDVVIVLTCLSYYYSGLDDDALFAAFGLLTSSDDAEQEYQEWVETAPTLPSEFRALGGVNLRDRVQCLTDIFPYLRYSKSAIDYYLSHLVFAKESKEFPHKLSASGWDLGKAKTHPTTGFSGTNDSRYVLPLGIKQLDLPEQNHTNALVLDYLLQPQNGIALMPRDTKGQTLDSQMLLHMVSNMSPNTRVILDVGAQVIDLDNLDFAKKWLVCCPDADSTQAVICCNEQDEIIVVDRSGKIEELQTSPFADQMDRCLVFLDEAHTRGTDLKLPANYRAAVTLGAGLTKDRLVQACMRMRKLGKGQTVEFCIPWEIEQKIMQLKSEDNTGHCDMTVSDVLCWVMTETCLDLRKAIPLWLNQGVRFSKQSTFWPEDKTGQEPVGVTSKWAEGFLEDEAQSLDHRYRPQKGHSELAALLDQVKGSMGDEFRSRCNEFGLTELSTCSLQEEQERELSPETQQERQVEKPPKAEPETHSITPQLRYWISNGSFPDNSPAFDDAIKPAFKALEYTSAASLFNVEHFPDCIRATLDFCKTVKGDFGPNNYSDWFQRPVQWILTSKTEDEPFRLVIISPFEAQELLPLIETSRNVTLHLYTPRVNLGFQSLDHLQLYCVTGVSHNYTAPRSIITLVNLFAGQLYLSSFDDYKRVCESLGLACATVDDSVTLGPDGFIPPGSKGTVVNRSGFTKSPVQFLKVLMEKIRHDCAVIKKTDMGKVFEGVRLLEDDFAERD
ncbi:hypothetical protein F66182_4914 [Fusarium sp. NRRL 66182]|nr:hypothetical protein F66182_4914 [Fusarium sp. NRRL 66182]